MADLSTIRPSWGEGNIKLASPITVGANAALDDRLVVDTYDSLYAAGTFTSIYPGMAVATKDTGDIYVYVGPKALEGSQTASNWKKVGDNSTVTADLTQVKKDVAANTTAINTEVADRKKAITDEVTARNTAITAAIELLDATVTKADKGVSVKIVEENGVIKDTSAVTVTPGTIGGATDGNVVTGAVVKAYVDKAVTSTYKVKGGVDEYSKLPTNAVEGDVYNVKAAFTLDFDKKPYPAGTNVVWVAATGSGDAAVAAHWDALGGTIDLSPYVKGSDMALSTVGGAGKVIRTVTQSNGKVTATAEALVAADIPTLAIGKIAGLQDALDAKATPENITTAIAGLNGDNIKSTLPGSSKDYTYVVSGNTIDQQIGVIDKALKNVSDRTSSAITAANNAGAAADKAKIAADAAQKTADDFINRTEGFATKAQGDKADSAIQNIYSGSDYIFKTISANEVTLTLGVCTDIAKDNAIALNKVADAKAVKDYVDTKMAGAVTSVGGKTGAITLKAAGTANGSVNLTMDGNALGASIVGLKSAAYTEASDYAQLTEAGGLDLVGPVNASAFVTKKGTGTGFIMVNQDTIRFTNSAGNHTDVLSMGNGIMYLNQGLDAVTIANVATPTIETQAANKSYVDSAVTSALTWEVI